MIRTGDEYRDSIRDGRSVWIDGEQVTDVTTHPAFRPIVDARARIYDMAHDPATQERMSYVDSETGERCPTGAQLPHTREDWHAKRVAVDTVLDDLAGIVTRVGDETVGEMWSLYDGQDVLDEIDPQFSAHIRHHVRHAELADPFHVSANTDPKGERNKRPQDQDPDVLLHVAGETDNGIIVRGAKFETAAAYANQAFVKPTIGDWGQQELSDYAVGFIADMGAPGIRHICRSSFAQRGSVEDYPLSGRFDEIDTMIVFDDVEIPWENVLFYRHTRAAAFIRATLHRYSMFAFVQRHLRFADLLVGAAALNANQTGVKAHQGVREKLAELACYREGIHAHLTAAIELGEPSPGGLLMPNQALLYTGRVLACTQLPAMMHLARDLCGGQLCVTPSAATFQRPRGGAVAGEVPRRRRRQRRAAPAAVRLRPRPAQLRLRRAPADVPAVRAVARRSPTCWPSTTTTTSPARWTWCAATPASRPARWPRPRRPHERSQRDARRAGGASVTTAANHAAARPRASWTSSRDGAVAIRDGRVVAVGETEEVLREWGDPTVRTIDATGRSVLPGLIECHSHPLFAGSRHAEYAKRLAGASLAEIAAAGGGIWASVLATRDASDDQLTAHLAAAYRRILAGGVTTLEVKSGYGLTAETELPPAQAAGGQPVAHAPEPVDLLPGRARRPRRDGGRGLHR